jgi:chaperonin GroEL (HSP60 family)
MPLIVKDVKVLLVDFSLEIKSPESEAKIAVSTPEQLESFLASEEKYLKMMTDKILSTGANVVFCQKGIDDVAQYYLAQAGVFACRRVSKSDMEFLSRATGAKILSNLHDVHASALGEAKEVEEKTHSDDHFIYLRGCQNQRVATLILRGQTVHVVDEIERAVKDGLGDVISTVKSGKIVPGGGAIEIELARRLRVYAKSMGGREQLAIEEFAHALESVPEALAENAGLDPLDILTELRKRHEAGMQGHGLNLFTDSIEDTLNAGIVEPLKVKTQAISSASEVAMMILRIDDVLVSKRGAQQMPRYEGID